MALEDVIERCIEQGVTHFELHDFLEGCDGDRVVFHWDLYKGDPVRWINIVMPWGIDVSWVGFGPHPKKFWGFMPVRVTLWPSWRVGVLTGGERHGYQAIERPTLESGLQAALRGFVCDGWTEGSPCPYEFCEMHGSEDCEPDW